MRYQPLARLTGRVSGFEALIRWQHPTQGLIGPEEFISIAEEIGLIVPLGERVLEQACEQLTRWQQLRVGLTMAGNLSGLQISQSDVTEHFRTTPERPATSSGPAARR